MFVLLVGVHAHAEVTPAQIDLWVEIRGGGTSVISTDTGSPLPDETELALASGQIESYSLRFDRVGEYSYSVALAPDASGVVYDATVYMVGVYVTDEDGELLANVVLSRSGEAGKYMPDQTDEEHPLKVVFNNSEGGNVTPADPTEPTNPVEPGQPAGGQGQGQSGKGSAPKTGDVSIPVWVPGLLLVAALVVLLIARTLAQRNAESNEGR